MLLILCKSSAPPNRFNAVEYFKFISTLKWIKCKNRRIGEAVSLCAIVKLTSSDQMTPCKKKVTYIHVH